MISLFLGEQGFLSALLDMFLSWSPEHLEINQSPPLLLLLFKTFFLFLDVDHFKSLYLLCDNIASVLCFGFLATRPVGS